MLKKSLFFFEEFSYITSFIADRYSQHNPLRLVDLSTWGQIHNVAGRGLITGWPLTQQGRDSEDIGNICVWPENGLLVDIETTTMMQSQPQVRCWRCSGIEVRESCSSSIYIYIFCVVGFKEVFFLHTVLSNRNNFKYVGHSISFQTLFV